MSTDTRLNLSAGILSVCVALILVLAKLWAFGETGALSVAASLGDSAMDLMISVGGLAAITYAARPPDEDHAFGHNSAEDLAALPIDPARAWIVYTFAKVGERRLEPVFAQLALTHEKARFFPGTLAGGGIVVLRPK